VDSGDPPELIDLLADRPRVDVTVIEDRTASARCDRGFLRVRRLTLKNRYEDGAESAEYAYDLVERDALDAVAIVLFTDSGEVCLRSALRPPLAFRSTYAIPIDDPSGPVLWEVPAGLVEPEERGEDGLQRCCARETLEEVGLALAPEAFERLGPAACLSPGVLAEKLHYFVARVEPRSAGAPTEDGSPVEERAEVRFIPIAEALRACRDGRIGDLKTETAIRRLDEHLAVVARAVVARESEAGRA
jgi:ADP-ribose pyrophosphatase